MNANKTVWARRYQAALEKHLAKGSGASLTPALDLGGLAVSLGLETLDVALIHGHILKGLLPAGGSAMSRQKTIERAKTFFTETLAPIDKTHSAAVKADLRVNQLTQALRRRTAESSASTRHLEKGIAQRQAAEAALKKSGAQRIQLARESTRLQKRLRSRTHEILSSQEEERRKTSRQLHDEIAQMLLSINLRLLTLKTSTKASTEGLKKEIAETQRLVKQSVKMIKRFNQELGGLHAT
ncbi:MAG: histidine kinase [Kiritimatiellia bacterium]